MAYSSSSSNANSKVHTCSSECEKSYAQLKKLYDEQREQLSDASVEIKAYDQGLKKVEAQLVVHQQNQLWYEQKIKFMKIDLDDKTDVLTYHKKLLAEALKEKEDLKTKFENWQSSSKNLGKLLNTQMSANDKFGLGYGDHRFDGILSYENEVLQSVFMNNDSNTDDRTLYDRFVTTDGMHAVPPPMTGNYIPSGPDIEIDESQFTYGPKQTKPSESDTRSSDFDSCESNTSVETLDCMPEPVVNEPKVVSTPKVWSDAPIIEEYESDSEDDEIVVKPKEVTKTVKPSFEKIESVNARNETVRQAENSRKNNKRPRGNKRNWNGMMTHKLGKKFEFNNKACYVCGSFDHLQYTCKHKEKINDQKQVKPVWNNSKRVNHQNFDRFSHPNPKSNIVPQAVLTKSDLVSLNTAKSVRTAQPRTRINDVMQKPYSYNKAYSSVKRPFNKKIANYNRYFNKRVNTVKSTRVNTAKPNAEVNTIKASASWVWKPKHEDLDHVSKSNSASKTLTRYDYVDALGRFKSVLAWDFKKTLTSLLQGNS
ncbi:hypothetical protein Tco_1506098 [Tanacetum coccineum]